MKVFKKERDAGEIKNWWAKKTENMNDTMVVGICKTDEQQDIEFRMLLADTGMPEDMVRTRGAKFDPDAKIPENAGMKAYDLAAPPPGAGDIPPLLDYAAMRAAAVKTGEEGGEEAHGDKDMMHDDKKHAGDM